MQTKCKIENCEGVGQYNRENGRTYFPQGFCCSHNNRNKKYGNPLIKVRNNYTGITKNQPLYKTYNGMKARCFNPNEDSYKYYGGRGIGIDKRWLGMDGFSNFLEDMQEKPESGFSLDRIDSSKNYSKENCRWANIYTQNSNKRSNNQNIGVYWDKKNSKWIAAITINKKYINLGRYSFLEDAISARKQAEIEFNIYRT